MQQNEKNNGLKYIFPLKEQRPKDLKDRTLQY